MVNGFSANQQAAQWKKRITREEKGQGEEIMRSGANMTDIFSTGHIPKANLPRLPNLQGVPPGFPGVKNRGAGGFTPANSNFSSEKSRRTSAYSGFSSALLSKANQGSPLFE